MEECKWVMTLSIVGFISDDARTEPGIVGAYAYLSVLRRL